MCTNYAAARRRTFEKYYGVAPPEDQWRDEAFQDYPAPIIRRNADADAGAREAIVATFGMIPRSKMPAGKRYSTMNARVETVGERPAYRVAWARQHLCLVPCEAIYEPNYESGKHERYRIELASEEPIAMAGLWRAWPGPEGDEVSFTLITVNADEHPLMRRMHKPGDEKRSVVILRPDEYDDWLGCRSVDEARSLLRLYPAELMTARPEPKGPLSGAGFE
jgi:putative SOS response-associated peptidase YedK